MRFPASGVAATAASTTERAPAASKAARAACSVAPVVTTSSTTSTRGGCRNGRAPNCGPRRREERFCPVCAGPWLRYSMRRHGLRHRAASARANSSAWS
jgi:hypothetical protein